MYCQFYGLKEKPFSITADPSFFFLSRRHQEALSHLVYGVKERKGIIVITGEIGTGKTTLCRFFLKHLQDNVKTAFILNPNFSDVELLEAIIRDFGIRPKQKSRFSFIWELNRFLIRRSAFGNNVVLIIDEAQNLEAAQLEQIRLLSNLETEKDKLIQIVLVGQPELNAKLELPQLRQLRQRIAVKYHVTQLARDEIQEYIMHRLTTAGAQGRVHFTDEAITLISDASAGIPRMINIICDRALLAGFNVETNTIDQSVIKQCLTELQ
jgi:general secretion pathway protein A